MNNRDNHEYLKRFDRPLELGTMLDGFMIRRCTQDDLKFVMDINEKTLPENYPQFFYDSILERFPESFLVCEEKKTRKIAGYVMFRVERSIESGLRFIKKGHLVSIAVLTSFQGRKIGETLLVEAMRRVLDYGVDQFVLEVRVTNDVAIKLYKKLTFEIQKDIPEYYKDGETAHYMVLKASNFQR